MNDEPEELYVELPNFFVLNPRHEDYRSTKEQKA
jgi:hypothetical protein